MMSLLGLLALFCTGSCVLAAPTRFVPHHFESPERNRIDREGTKWLHEHRDEILPPPGHYDGVTDKVRPIIQYRDEKQQKPGAYDGAMDEIGPLIQHFIDSKLQGLCDDKNVEGADCLKSLSQGESALVNSLKAGLGP